MIPLRALFPFGAASLAASQVQMLWRGPACRRLQGQHKASTHQFTLLNLSVLQVNATSELAGSSCVCFQTLSLSLYLFTI